MTHPESLLAYVLEERTDFIRNKFPAIIEWPERMDLWDKFCDIYKNYVPSEEELHEYENSNTVTESPNEKAAMDFYRAHKEEMDKGAVVLWKSRFPLHKLFMEKVSIGSKAFNSEFQNDALDPDSQMFDPSSFLYHDSTMEFPHSEFKIGFGCDFGMGKDKGDYSAVSVVAQHKRTKVCYVAESYIRRVHPDVFLKDIVEMTKKWQPDVISAEAQMAQEFFVDVLKRELQNIGYPAHSRVKKVQQRSRKELRIESMLPDIDEHRISFNRNHRELLTQFERYGVGKTGSNFDDGPDSLEMAISGLKKSTARVSRKPSWV